MGRTGGEGGAAAEGGAGEGGAGEGGAAAEGGTAGASGSGGHSPCSTSIADMVCIPGGTFVLGGEITGGEVVHEATVRTFYIDRNEVTAAAYAACVRRGACLAKNPSDVACNIGKAGYENDPINCVTWADASAFCSAASKRLPTEEEWVYAARRGERTYPWGNALPDPTRGNLLSFGPGGSDGFPSTAPVGSFPAGATPDGINDLFGNVWEWLASAYCVSTGLACTSCSSPAPCQNPCNACGSESRVHRGYGYLDVYDTALPLGWNWRGYAPNSVDAWSSYLGFRCAK
jgi:formylglycine-generating enzyme required for sulfatase activity